MELLLKQIEENSDDTRLDEDFPTLNEFHDDDLSMYPAIRIREQNFSADEFEIIANNILSDIAAANEATIEKPARSLVALAFNSLMDPGRVDYGSDHEKPLFHKEKYKKVENWFRVCGESDLDLRDYSIERTDVRLKLKLIREEASDFERKASIGAWAYYHLRAINSNRGFIWTKPTIDIFNKSMTAIYGFEIVYAFPKLPKPGYVLLKSNFIYDRSGELLYLLYRSMILVEGDMYRDARPQRMLLDKLAFGYPQGLGEGGYWLWNWVERASSRRNLNISVERLIIELELAFDELDKFNSRFEQHTSVFRQNLANLRIFHEKYIASQVAGSSRYFKYARLVNEFYFNSLRLRPNRELICALIHIVKTRSNIEVYVGPQRPPYIQWGQVLGGMILSKHDDDLANRFGRVNIRRNY